DVGHSLQRQIEHADAGVDVGRGVREGIDGADLRAKAERKAAIGALPGIRRRALAARQLLCQVIELVSQGNDRGPDKRCLATNAIDRHETLTWTGSACRTSAGWKTLRARWRNRHFAAPADAPSRHRC